MSKYTEKIALIVVDMIAVTIAVYLVYAQRLYQTGDVKLTIIELVEVCVYLMAAWFIILLFFDSYRSKFSVSRTDEILTVFKAVTFGTVSLYLYISWEDREFWTYTRIAIFYYWALLIFNISIGRIIIRANQRKRRAKGLGHRKTLIIGTGKRAFDTYIQIKEHPIIGFDVRNFIKTSNVVHEGIPQEKIAGTMDTYIAVCEKEKIEEVLIILDRPSRRRLFGIVDQCNGYPVSMKTIPDIYQIAVGNARISNIFGLQLVDILPEKYSFAFSFIKRMMDILVSAIVVFLFLPLWVIIGVAIKINSKGPVFYKQDRLGKNGEVFPMYKFRSMVQDAEKLSGPSLTVEQDPRITKFGRFLRKMRLDEIPQFINVLEGDMSLIGPRPERPFFVEQFVKQIPLYSKRFRIRPGITGWAQVKQSFKESIKDVQKKLEYDLFYIENMSLLLDVKIMLATFYTIIARHGG